MEEDDPGSDANHRLNMWAGVSYNGRSELVIWDALEGTVNGTRKCMPKITESIKASNGRLRFVVEDGAKPHVGPDPRQYREKHANVWKRLVGPAPYKPNGEKVKQNAESRQDWPARSPDINLPIEYMWSYMEARLKPCYTSKAELRAHCLELWEKVPQDHIQKIIDRLPSMMKWIASNSGARTRY